MHDSQFIIIIYLMLTRSVLKWDILTPCPLRLLSSDSLHLTSRLECQVGGVSLLLVRGVWRVTCIWDTLTSHFHTSKQPITWQLLTLGKHTWSRRLAKVQMKQVIRSEWGNHSFAVIHNAVWIFLMHLLLHYISVIWVCSEMRIWRWILGLGHIVTFTEISR